jgi:hypothetical protein
VEVPGDALVIRFRPTNPDRVMASVLDAYKLYGRYQASAFAAAAVSGETETDLRRRLLAVADIAGMTQDRHPKYYVCTRAEELLRRGFTFWKDGDDDEDDEHYSVDFGTAVTRDDVEKFLGVFGPAEERRLLW